MSKQQTRTVSASSPARQVYSGLLLCLCCLSVALFSSCSSRKNTAANRFYHSFTTRYNVYHNGKKAYEEAYNQLIEQKKESYSELLNLEPVGYNPIEPKANTGGPFDPAIIKARKAISLHSIRSKPERDFAGKASSKQRAFLEQTEYNPFLHNAWMLLGQSQYYNADFLEAMATFAYVARLYKTQPEIRDAARMWQLRCYNAMGWTSEGERVLELISKDAAANAKGGLYDLCLASRYLHEKKWGEAISHLRQAAKAERHPLQRARMYYLLGQVAQIIQDYPAAIKAYGKVIRLHPPFELDLAARIRRTEIQGFGNPLPVAKKLERMARQYKYAEIQDQVYLAAGHVYMEIPDTTKAIKAYHLAADSSKARATDYALANLRLGDIYMARKQYTKAQPVFSAALSSLEKGHPDYTRVSELSTKLDALALHASALAEQDSLLRLAAMPETERKAIIDSAIAAAKKAAKEAERMALNEQLQQQREQNEYQDEFNRLGDRNKKTIPQPVFGGASSEFYFYNPQLITQGKGIFEKKWGRRRLEDNWRRRQKDVDFSPTESEDQANAEEKTGSTAPSSAPDSTTRRPGSDAPNASQSSDEEADPLQPAYYLRNIPFSPEAQMLANQIIAESLWGMGAVFDEQFEFFGEAIHSYETLLGRYPDTEKKPEALYKLFTLYSRIHQVGKAEQYRQRLLAEYPDEPISQALQDPQYLDKLRRMDKEQEELYQKAYQAYLSGQVQIVREYHRLLRETYPTASLLPKMAFLDALCFVLEGNNEGFKKALQDLVQQTDEKDIAELTQEMLSQLLNGRRINKGGYKEIDWDLGSATRSQADTTLAAFGLRNEPYRILLIYPQGSADRNAVVFAVSAFNYARFTRYTLDAIPSRMEGREQVTISSLPSASVAWFYIRQAYAADAYMSQLSDQALLFPISESNAKLLTEGRSLAEYMDFVEKSYRGPDAEMLLLRWKTLLKTNKTDVKKAPEQPDRPELPQAPADIPVKPITFDFDHRLSPPDSLPLRQEQAIRQDSLHNESSKEETLARPVVTLPEQNTFEDAKQLYLRRKEQERAEKKAIDQLKKEKEKERRETIRQKEQERKQQEKQRKEEQRKREKEREKLRKQREKERREKEKERERLRKQREKEKREARKQT